MNTESLKAVLTLLGNTTESAKTAFYVWIAYDFVVDLLIAFTIIFLTIYILNKINKDRYIDQNLVELYHLVRKKYNLPKTRDVYLFELSETMDELKK